MTTRLTIPPPQPLSGEQRERLRHYLVAEYQSTLPAGDRSAARRRVLVAAVACVVVAALGASAYAAYLLTRPSDQLTIGCYARARLDANTAVLPADGRTPTTVCASAWQRVFPQQPKPAAFSACVLGSGAVAVFPATAADTCNNLGLAPFSPAYRARSEALSFARLKRALVAAFLNNCLGEQRARATARRLLDAHGYRAWRIATPRPFTRTRPCASLAFDQPNGTLILIPMPRG